ncbi:hypothetical protein SASPL_131566 [Salvia splendens]|uniref:Uncharacterized protein n=1 Tax=Salvia splendens TaxID=180675 RepID=A0A8X8ZL37_SALSN|nr:uncharacterized protein LOC121755710 [Salvia splendens]KAG6408553.1 hypothetical protein SASPL_131566 [Salvia splendens]
MSLVDYADSSDEDEPQNPPAAAQEKIEQLPENPEERPAPDHLQSRVSTALSPPPSKQSGKVPDQSPVLKLPDAAFLLDSPVVPSQLNAPDHSSRVAAAMAESAARKRDLNVSAGSYPRNKVPKGMLPNTKSVPETVGGHLLPPQLSGRSNVVTEDISKLFVRKHADTPAE